MNDEFLNSFLSDVEKAALQTVADNALLLGALQKVILADLYFKGTLRKDIAPDATRNAALSLAITQTDLSNEKLGADIRALAEGVRLVEGGFARLAKFKTSAEEDKPKGNRAR